MRPGDNPGEFILESKEEMSALLFGLIQRSSAEWSEEQNILANDIESGFQAYDRGEEGVEVLISDTTLSAARTACEAVLNTSGWEKSMARYAGHLSVAKDMKRALYTVDPPKPQ